MTIANDNVRARLDFALSVAQETSKFILRYYQNADLAVELKGDLTPVTAADRGAEQMIRERLATSFPSDGVLGEEFGESPSSNGFRWILDPVDGTKSFVHGVPLFGTLIGLEYGGRMVVGVCRFPALDEVVYAAEGSGTWWQQGNATPKQTYVTEQRDLSQALFCTTTFTGWAKIDRKDALEKMSQATLLTRGWGDCYGHILVATGRAEVTIDPLMNPWDIAALIPIVQEAGGHHIDWMGKVSIASSNGLSVNAALKNAVLDVLKP